MSSIPSIYWLFPLLSRVALRRLGFALPLDNATLCRYYLLFYSMIKSDFETVTITVKLFFVVFVHVAIHPEKPFFLFSLVNFCRFIL